MKAQIEKAVVTAAWLLLTVLVTGAYAGASTTTITGAARFGSEAMRSTFTASPGGAEYALELSSGLFIGSGPIRFQDGSSQLSARHFVSSTSIMPEQTFTDTSFGPCVTGSTITFEAPYDQFLGISFAGSISADQERTIGLSILLDGETLSDYDGAGIVQSDLNEVENLSFLTVPTVRVTKGEHTICLQAKTSAGTGTLRSDSTSKALIAVLTIK